MRVKKNDNHHLISTDVLVLGQHVVYMVGACKDEGGPSAHHSKNGGHSIEDVAPNLHNPSF